MAGGFAPATVVSWLTSNGVLPTKSACDTIPAMSQRSHARGEDDRRRFVVDPDVLAALDLMFEQLSDPDVRSVVIRYEHPEFEEALKEGRREIEGSDGSMNPRLHLLALVVDQPGITLAQAATQFGLKDATGLYAVARRLQNDGLMRKSGVELHPTAKAQPK